jgi:hypothetical protein
LFAYSYVGIVELLRETHRALTHDEIIAGQPSKASKKLCRNNDGLIYLKVCCKNMPFRYGPNK